MATSAVAAASGFSAHIEGGIGNLRVPPIAVPYSFAGTGGAGISYPTGPVRFALEIAASVGDDLPFELRIPEAPATGKRSLTTFLLEIEAVERTHARGPFASVGLGVGHATLTGASGGSQRFGQPGWAYADQEYIGPAFGAGIGWRSEGGPGPLGFQFAARFHGVAHDSDLSSYAFALTLGLAY